MTDDDVPRMHATVLDSTDPRALGRFYGALLEWAVYEDDETWVRVRPATGPGLSIQYESRYTPPTWPAADGEQLMMSHLDLLVDDLPAAVARAETLGARQAEHQPQDDVRVMLDLDGHPFCLFEQ